MEHAEKGVHVSARMELNSVGHGFQKGQPYVIAGRRKERMRARIVRMVGGALR